MTHQASTPRVFGINDTLKAAAGRKAIQAKAAAAAQIDLPDRSFSLRALPRMRAVMSKMKNATSASASTLAKRAGQTGSPRRNFQAASQYG